MSNINTLESCNLYSWNSIDQQGFAYCSEEFEDDEFVHAEYSATPDKKDDNVSGAGDYPLFRIALNGGYSHLTQKVLSDVPEVLNDYMTELKSGFHFGGKGTIFIHENIGLGVDFNLFKTSHTLDNVSISGNAGNVAFGVLRDDVSVLFIAPSLSTRVLSQNKKNAFFTHLGVGYLGYSNEGIFIQTLNDLTGNTLGVSAGLGFDLGLVEGISLGLNISYIIGTITELSTESELSSESIELSENVSHVNISVGLRFW